MAGKGSKRRKENYTRFINNYETINWSDKTSNTVKPDETGVNKPQQVTKQRNKQCC